MSSLVRRLLTVAVLCCSLGALGATQLSAQRRVTRSFTVRRSPVVETVDTAGPAVQLLGLLPTAPAEAPTGKWILAPSGSTSSDASQLGMYLGFANSGLLSTLDWDILVGGTRSSESGPGRTQWEAAASITLPALGPTRHQLVPIMGIQQGWTPDVERGTNLSLEIDVTLDSALGATLGPVAYYDWVTPSGGTTTHGATLGLIGYVEIGPLQVLPEYDFAGGLSDEDDYNLTAKFPFTLKRGGAESALKFSWAKGDVFSMQFEFGVLVNGPKQTRTRRR